jgi:hypothetical protein
MKKNWWFLPATVLVVFGLLMMGCDTKGDYPEEDDFVPFEYDFKDDGSEYNLWGSNNPTLADGALSITASSSTGFSIKFEDIGYNYVASDILVFTYWVDVETPEAVLTVKNASRNDDWKDTEGDYGIGKGREIFLGSELEGASIHTGPTLDGTWDNATKTGTFEVSMALLKRATAVGFQHNVWAEFPSSTKVAENSKYKVKITRIENKKGEIEGGDGDGDGEEGEADYDISALKNPFEWTSVGLAAGTVIDLGYPSKVDAETQKPRWDINDTSATKFSTFANAFAPSSVTTGNLYIVFGDTANWKTNYWQIAMQWIAVEVATGDNKGGKGWAQHDVFGGGTFPDLAGSTTFTEATKLVTVPLTSDAINYLKGGQTDTGVVQGGIAIFPNSGGDHGIVIKAIGIGK